MVFMVAASANIQAKQGKSTVQSDRTAKVDLNNSTEKQLEELPGVGKVTAKKIIAGRPYTSTDDLAKAGLSKNTIAQIAPLVTVGTPGSAAKSEGATTAQPSAQARAERSAPTGSTAYTPPPAPGMVWVNLTTKVYHKEGDPWYGRTKHGKYMTEADAIKAGYRAAKQK